MHTISMLSILRNYIKLLAAFLIATGYIGCSSQGSHGTKETKTAVKDSTKTDSVENKITSSDTATQQKKKDQPEKSTVVKNVVQPNGKKSPIIKSALRNSHFDAVKWLKSDYDFSRRTKLNSISEYDPIIKKMARRYGFDWRLIAAQIYTESNFKNRAKSHVGATGLMQIMPNTAKFMGFDPNTMIKPETNIAVGCMYNQRMYSLWKRQTKDYNRLAFALASYNAGRGRVLKSYSTKDSLTTWEKVHPSLPEETQSYVHKIYLKHDLYSRYILP